MLHQGAGCSLCSHRGLLGHGLILFPKFIEAIIRPSRSSSKVAEEGQIRTPFPLGEPSVFKTASVRPPDSLLRIGLHGGTRTRITPVSEAGACSSSATCSRIPLPLWSDHGSPPVLLDVQSHSRKNAMATRARMPIRFPIELPLQLAVPVKEVDPGVVQVVGREGLRSLDQLADRRLLRPP